ncbi:hypothetical protein V8E53_013193 [Lactarius tabidus]
MAPRTRKSHPKATADRTYVKENENQLPLQTSNIANTKRSKVPARRVIPENQSLNPQQVVGKRTSTPTQAPSNAHSPTSQPFEAPAKKARRDGPAHGHPMPLMLPSGSSVESGNIASPSGDFADQQRKLDGAVKGKRVELEHTLSFYPGRGDNTHPLARLDRGNFAFHAPPVDDDGTETEDSADDDTAEVSLKHPSKFLESLAIERPSWGGSGASEPDTSAGSLDISVGVPAASLSAQTDLIGPRVTWPVATDLVLAAGSSKLSLLSQRPIVRAVIQEAIENLRAGLLFSNAFPDVCNALTLIKDCLLTAALRLKPGATEMLEQLTHDQDYLLKITPLPHARICLIRSEIKERCNAITMGIFLLFDSPMDTIDYVDKQLFNYTYTFPRAGSHNNLVMRTRPYRNDRIINVIRDMFFAGGAASFARRFRYLFPTYEARHGEETLEVPIVMVALVATALYVTLYEWRHGDQQVREFSANAYLDVYLGHVNTLKHIRENHNGAFHLMMADIYAQANTASDGNEPAPSIAIADLDLDGLDG